MPRDQDFGARRLGGLGCLLGDPPIAQRVDGDQQALALLEGHQVADDLVGGYGDFQVQCGRHGGFTS
jgi:hypothetical protein